MRDDTDQRTSCIGRVNKVIPGNQKKLKARWLCLVLGMMCDCLM